MGRLSGRVAIVTGGSRGIGASIARTFAREGARVVIASRKLPGLQVVADAINKTHPDSVVPIPCHMGHDEQIEAFVAQVTDTVGVADILVNNAATNPYFGPMIDLEWAAWEKTFSVNLRGSFGLSRAVARVLMAGGRSGSIINMSSVYGTAAAPGQGIYGMTKAAMISMTRTLALEWGEAGIRVNAIAPGLVDTRFASAIVNNPELVRVFTERSALGRYAEPDEIAGMALFLASEASSFVTGQTMVVDGGYTIS